MAYFGRKVKKPLQNPGFGSGGKEQRAEARLSGLVRKAVAGRQERPGRALRSLRAARSERSTR